MTIVDTPQTSEAKTIPLVTENGFRKTGKSANGVASQYTEILNRVRDAGLLKRIPSFYMKRLAVISAVSLGLWTALYFISLSTAIPVLALAIPVMILQGIMAAQYAFIAHETAHRQVFNSNKTNDRLGRVLANLFAGLSYGFWMKKHNRHHAKPNQIGADPDIAIRVFSFTPESLEEKKGFEKKLSQNQGWLFPFLLMLTGFDMLLDSMMTVFSKDKKLNHRMFEFSMMVVRQSIPIVISLLLFSPIYAIIVWLAFQFSFGLFMGGAFAPNHKGMPLVPREAKIDFFQRQVLTSRNIKSTWLTDNLMGGLNFQVEHHLFPSMPRPNLNAAHKIVVDYCKEKDVPFVETGLWESYGIVIDYLNKVGLSRKSADPFVCPMIADLRPRN
jgi:fatty acid desaturase